MHSDQLAPQASSSQVIPPPSTQMFTYNPLQAIGSTASLVGMLKAAALDPFTNHDSDDHLDDELDNSPVPNIPTHPSDEDSDDDSAQEQIAELTPNCSPHSSSFRGPDQLGYPSPQAMHGLACELINQQKRLSDIAIRNSPRSIISHINPLNRPSSILQRSYRTSPIQTPSLEDSRPTNERAEPSNEDLNSVDSDSNVTSEERLHRLEDQFGVWTGKDESGSVEEEHWIGQVPGVLYRSVLVIGLIVLTNRRLCYLAYLPSVDKGMLIRSGSVTIRADSRFNKRRRRWVELRTNSLTQYRSSSEPFRPLSSYHFSEIRRILPIAPGDPKILSFRLLDGRVVHTEFDTVEAANQWHQDFVRALFSFKTDYSNQIKMMIPLRRIRKMQRDSFENLAKIMVFDVDCASSLCYTSKSDVVEQKFNSSGSDRPRVELSYYLTHGPFDEAIVDAIVRAKMEIPPDSSAYYTPSPLLEVLDSSPAEDEAEEENSLMDKTAADNSSNSKLASRFIKAFGLDSSEKLSVYSCALLRTLPTSGHMALSKEYLCFWRRGNVITQDFKLRIPLKDVGQIKYASAFGFTRFGIAIELAGAADIRIDFTPKALREEVMEALRVHVEAAKALERRAARRQSHGPMPKPLGQNTEEIRITSPNSRKKIPVVIGNIQIDRPVGPLRIVCLAIGSRGDVQPYIALAKRLIQDGHTVTIASHPEYRSWVESFGILYRDVGGDPAALMKLSVDHPFFSAGFFKEGIGRFRTWLDDLFMESWTACKETDVQLLIESPSTFAGIHIAEALRIPYFRAFTMTWTSTSAYPQAFASSIDLGPSYNLLSYSLFDNLIWKAMSGQVNRWRKNTLGIPVTTMEKMQPYKVPFLYNFSSVVVPRPLDWRDHIDVTGYWFLDQSHGDYVPPADLEAFIASARADGVPLIYVGFGSITVPDSAAVTRAIYSAVVQAGVRAIVAKGWSERANTKAVVENEDPPPPEVYVLQAVPHDWLFPQLDAVCHHGGAGTTGISLRFGIPTLIHPFFGDQPFWADRVANLGAGLRVDSLTTNCLAEGFIKATTDRIIKEKAVVVGEKIRAEDGVSRAVRFIYQHLDFALERTVHRIERTKPKKRWVTVTSLSGVTSAAVAEVSPPDELESGVAGGEGTTSKGAAGEKVVGQVVGECVEEAVSPGSQAGVHQGIKSAATEPNMSLPVNEVKDDSELGLERAGAADRVRKKRMSMPMATMTIRGARRAQSMIRLPDGVSPVRSWTKLKKMFS